MINSRAMIKAHRDKVEAKEKELAAMPESPANMAIDLSFFDRERPKAVYQGLRDVKDSEVGQVVAALLERLRIQNEINEKRYHEKGYYFQGRLEATTEMIDALYSMLDEIVMRERMVKAEKAAQPVVVKTFKDKFKGAMNQLLE